MVAQFSQYPSTITVTVKQPATQDLTTRVWTAGTSKVYTFPCRVEPNRMSRRVMMKNGQVMDYASDVYMPWTDVDIPEGAEYTLSSGEHGAIKKQHRGQLNCRLWL